MKKNFNKLYDNYKKLLEILENVINFIMCTTILIMIISVLANIVLRNARASAPWLSELAQFSCVWAVYIGLGLAIKKKMLAGLDILVLVVKGKGHKVLKVTQDVLMIGFLLAFIVTSKPLIDLLVSSGRSSASMRIPVYIGYLGPLIGSIFALFFAIDLLIRDLIGDKIDTDFLANEEVDEELMDEILTELHKTSVINSKLDSI